MFAKFFQFAVAAGVIALSFALPKAVGMEPDAAPVAAVTPHVSASSAIDAGRYLTLVGACHDCHTDGYSDSGGKVAEKDWLAGSAIGWRGPWGTTYPSNLRLFVTEISEDAWVTMLRTRQGLPPMPWENVRELSEADSRAIYRYIRSLGPTGTRMPAAVGPDKEPATAFYNLSPTQPKRLRAEVEPFE